MKNLFGALAVIALLCAASTTLSAAAICPTTTNTNTDCGFILTINAGGSFTGVAVTNANPYDGSDDALVGVVNNSGAVFNGTIHLTGSGNGGGIFEFDGDGICTYITASFCSTASTGYEGPITTFANINAAGTAGDVVFHGLADGATTYFSLEGSPASIGGNLTGTPEPGTIALLGSGLVGLALLRRRRA